MAADLLHRLRRGDAPGAQEVLWRGETDAGCAEAYAGQAPGSDGCGDFELAFKPSFSFGLDEEDDFLLF